MTSPLHEQSQALYNYSRTSQPTITNVSYNGTLKTLDMNIEYKDLILVYQTYTQAKNHEQNFHSLC